MPRNRHRRNMKGQTLSDKISHCFPSQVAYIYLLFWLLLTISRPLLVASHIVEGVPGLSGSPASCRNEGEEHPNPFSDTHPCITCYCNGGQIECATEKCQTEGCYMVLAGAKQHCCKICKGCEYNNRTYPSGSQWTNPTDPCQTLHCQSGVVTISQQQCYSPCRTTQAPLKGQCCPSCEGCQLSGMTFRDGDEFVLEDDRCVRCKCKSGHLVCVKRVCPVLPCPASKIIQKPNTCCPECLGERELFEVRGCILRTFHPHGERFKVDNCTSCVCNKSTSICERETCLPLPCSPELQVVPDGECCPKCGVRPQISFCVAAGQRYKEGATWQPNSCTTCECLNGKPLCLIDQCNSKLTCSAGYKIEKRPEDCCPKCSKEPAVCTVFGDPHYRTFDRRIFSFQGSCKYILSEDCSTYSFSVRVKNGARKSRSFTWTKSIFIKVNSTKVVLLQQAKIKVDGKRIKPPFTKQGVLSIKKYQYNITLETTLGMTILWNGDSFLEIAVPPSFQGKLCGLCGNFNNDSSDDFLTRKGKLASNVVSFGRSWRVGGTRLCDRPDKGPSPEPVCRWDSRFQGRQTCELLKGAVFQACHQTVSVQTYLKSCILDMCECPANKQCYCDAFMAYAHECARSGVNLKWRQASNCTETMQTSSLEWRRPNNSEGSPCRGGKVFSSCGSSCPGTCESLHATSTQCPSLCVEGCFCPTGTVLHKNRCIKPEECPPKPIT